MIENNGTPARVIASHRASLTLHSADSAFSVALGRSNPLGSKPAIGDWLLVDPVTNNIVAQLPRRNWLQRRQSGMVQRAQVMTANFDHLFIVTSANQNFSESRLERGLVLASQGNVCATIVVTKADLCAELASYQDRAANMVALPECHWVNAKDQVQCQNLLEHIGFGQTIALIGSSGVGKSTLINSLTGTTKQATQSVRDKDSKGRHTTVSRSLIQLPTGSLIVDNPGIREIGVFDAQNAVAEVFQDIETLATGCRFANCRHENEPECAIKSALNSGALNRRRFENYQNLLEESQPPST